MAVLAQNLPEKVTLLGPGLTLYCGVVGKEMWLFAGMSHHCLTVQSGTEEAQTVPSPDTLLWHPNYPELKTLETQQMWEGRPDLTFHLKAGYKISQEKVRMGVNGKMALCKQTY